MLLCGMNFINLIRIQFIFGIEDQLILSYNPIIKYADAFLYNRKVTGQYKMTSFKEVILYWETSRKRFVIFPAAGISF